MQPYEATLTVQVQQSAVVNAVLLRPLPFPDGDRLVALYEASPSRGQRASLIAPARLEDWQRMNRTFTAVSGSYTENVTDTSGADPWTELAAAAVQVPLSADDLSLVTYADTALPRASTSWRPLLR